MPKAKTTKDNKTQQDIDPNAKYHLQVTRNTRLVQSEEQQLRIDLYSISPSERRILLIETESTKKLNSKELAKLTGMNDCYIRELKARPSYKRAVAELQLETVGIIQSYHNTAAAVFAEGLFSTDEKTRLNTAEAILGKALEEKAAQTQEHTVTVKGLKGMTDKQLDAQAEDIVKSIGRKNKKGKK